MKKIGLLLTVLGLLLITDDSAFGQNERRADESARSETTISMKRDGFPCGYLPAKNDLSNCPAYSMVIAEDGTVTYEGIMGVKAKGKRVFMISLEQVKELIADFERVNFFQLQDKYTEKRLPDGSVRTIDHSNGTTITLQVGNKTKSVYNFYGAPEELVALQNKLDDISRHLQK